MRQTKPKFTEHKESIGDALGSAMSELESLGEEMRSWADNIEEKFSNTEKYERVSECADTLEGLSAPDVPESLEARIITYHQGTKKQMSRSDRRDDACSILESIVQELEDITSDEEAKQDLKDEAEEFRDEVQNLIDEAQGLEFPGMFG